MKSCLMIFLFFLFFIEASSAQLLENGAIYSHCLNVGKIRINRLENDKPSKIGSVDYTQAMVKEIAAKGCSAISRTHSLGYGVFSYGVNGSRFIQDKFSVSTRILKYDSLETSFGKTDLGQKKFYSKTDEKAAQDLKTDSKTKDPEGIYFSEEDKKKEDASQQKFDNAISETKKDEAEKNDLVLGLETKNSQISSNQDEIYKKEDEIQKSKDIIADLKEKRKTASESDKNSYKTKIDNEKANISKLESEIKALNKNNKELEKNIAQDEKSIEKKDDIIESKINAADEIRSAEKSDLVAGASKKLEGDIEGCSKANRIYKSDSAETKIEKQKKLEDCKNEKIQNYNDEMAHYKIAEAEVVDSNPSKELDENYFESKVGRKVFNGYCASTWQAFQDKPESLEEIMNNPPSGGFEPGSCERYSTVSMNEFYSKKRTLEETAKLINKGVLCADTALESSASCSASAEKFVSCAKVDEYNYDQLKQNLCPDSPEVKLANGKDRDDTNTVKNCRMKCEAGAKDTLGTCFNNAQYTQLSKKIEHCFAYKSVATINFDGEDQIDNSDVEYASFDGKYTCQRRSAFTADYQYCKKLVVAYNAAFAADQGMAMAEGIQRTAGEANAMGKFAEGQATGNTQVAGLNSIQSIAKTNENIENQKLALSGAKVVAFTSMMINWPTVNNIYKTCEKYDVQHPQECSNAVHFANDNGSAKDIFFPNYIVKQAFYTELIRSAGDAAIALIKGNMYRKQQGLIDGVKNDIAAPEDSGGFVYDPSYCERYPTSAQCRGRGNRVSVDGFSGGGLNLVGGGAQDYSFSNDDLGEYNEGRGVTSNAQKADISSMLNDNVEKGGSDFNKVAGAKVSASGASGGGGSPGAGGGSASLVGGGSGGEGASGASKDGFGVTKSNAKYAAASGSAGYSGSKARQFGKDKKVDNPFSSLFGAKKNSRDVASNTENDIAPAQSSLFKKISNRYMEVKNQKRLLDSQVK